MEILAFGPQAEKQDNTGPLTVFMHGFPAIRSRQNRDLAEKVAELRGAPVQLLLYSGLGHAPGVFSFERTLEDVRGFFTELAKEQAGRKIDLVGHSWGGFLSLQMIKEFPHLVRRLVLMSPLLGFGEAEAVRSSFENTRDQNPKLSLEPSAKLAEEFSRIGERYPTQESVAAVPESIDVLFLQAKNDDITPTPVALKRIPLFRRAPELRLADNDHSFLSNRDELAREIAEFLMR